MESISTNPKKYAQDMYAVCYKKTDEWNQRLKIQYFKMSILPILS